MELYVANLSRRVEHFTFRFPKQDKVHQYPISPAHQLKIPLKLTDEQIREIIRQKEMYGMVAADTVPKVTFFAGLCYALDRPITDIQIERGFAHNDGALMEESAQNRVNAAAATAAQIEEQTEGTMRTFRQDTIEVPPIGGDTSNTLEEVIEVIRPGEQSRRTRRTVN